LHPKKKPRFIQEIVQAHRIVGIVSAAFVLLLAVSGMLLNHTDALGLGQRYVQSTAMQWWYGMAAPDVLQSYPVGGAWVTQVEDSLYYNARPLGRHYAPLQGAIDVGDEVALALADGILLLDRQGNTVEELRAQQGQSAVRAIGEAGGRVVVQREGQRLIADPALSTWTRVTRQKVRWATAAAPPAALRQAIRQDYQNRMLNAERVVRDLHNGRILGPWGALLMDMMALAFIAMALSGAWMWWQRRNGLLAEGKRARKSTH
jgi:hypothetical protein